MPHPRENRKRRERRRRKHQRHCAIKRYRDNFANWMAARYARQQAEREWLREQFMAFAQSYLTKSAFTTRTAFTKETADVSPDHARSDQRTD